MSFRIVREAELRIPAEARNIRQPGKEVSGDTQSVRMDLRQFYDEALRSAVREGNNTALFALPEAADTDVTNEEALQIALESFTTFLEEHELEIMLVIEDGHTGNVSGSLFDSVEKYLGEGIGGSIPGAMFDSRRTDSFSCAMFDSPGGKGVPFEADMQDVCDEMQADDFVVYATPSSAGKGIEEKREEKKDRKKKEDKNPLKTFFACTAKTAESTKAPDETQYYTTLLVDGSRSKPLDERMRDIEKDEKSFSHHLQQLINKKGLKNSEVYSCANISKQYFSKLMSGGVKPSKEKVMSLAVGLRLNLDETIDFLKLAGYAFSPISQTDTVVTYFIEHQDYSVLKIDIVLFDYGLEPLSGNV